MHYMYVMSWPWSLTGKDKKKKNRWEQVSVITVFGFPRDEDSDSSLIGRLFPSAQEEDDAGVSAV